MTIEELGNQLADGMWPRLPIDREQLDLKFAYKRRKQHRATKRTAPVEEYFHPEPGDELVFRFVERSVNGKDEAPRGAMPSPTPIGATRAQRLLQELVRLESDPRVNFIALKWFRDINLPAHGFPPEEARQELDAAIRRGAVRVIKLANPRSPFPTSTLQLDRNHAEVRGLMQTQPAAARPRFVPMDLGVKVSDEILAGRR